MELLVVLRFRGSHRMCRKPWRTSESDHQPAGTLGRSCSSGSHPEQREFAVWPQIPAGMLQPAFIGPGRARIAVNDGFRSFPGSETQAGVLGHLSEIAPVGGTERCFIAP